MARCHPRSGRGRPSLRLRLEQPSLRRRQPLRSGRPPVERNRASRISGQVRLLRPRALPRAGQSGYSTPAGVVVAGWLANLNSYRAGRVYRPETPVPCLRLGCDRARHRCSPRARREPCGRDHRPRARAAPLLVDYSANGSPYIAAAYAALATERPTWIHGTIAGAGAAAA
jgi:hypothetical protein